VLLRKIAKNALPATGAGLTMEWGVLQLFSSIKPPATKVNSLGTEQCHTAT
jgi:hypothetical protein